MKTTEDKNLKEFIGKIMPYDTIESPSANFSAKVMAKVSIMEQKSAQSYKLLIPTFAWIIIFVAVLAIILYAYFGQPTDSATNRFFNYTDITSEINGKLLRIILYSITIFLLMLMAEMLILKNYFEHKIEHNRNL